MSITIVPIAGTEVRMVSGAWPLPEAMRQGVPTLWARIKAEKPQTWDGRILAFTPPRIGEDGILRADALEDAYSAFLAWRKADFPEIGVLHVFAAALILSSDGALIFGIMGGDSVNAGRVYPPGGSVEPRDVGADGLVDAEACLALELWEETGLRVEDAEMGPLLAIFEGAKLSISRVLRFDKSADALMAEIRANLEQQDERELADVVACRNAEDGRAAGDLASYAAGLLDALSAGRLVLS